MGLLERQPRSADVIASSPMRLLRLTHWEIRRMSDETVARIKAIIEQRRRSQAATDPTHPRHPTDPAHAIRCAAGLTHSPRSPPSGSTCS